METFKLIIFIVALLVMFYLLFTRYNKSSQEQELEEMEAVENSDELILDIYYLGKYCKEMNITIQDLHDITTFTHKSVEEEK